MEQEKQNLVELNQETIQIIQQLLQIFEKVHKNFQLLEKNINVNKEVVQILQKTGKKCDSIEKLIPKIVIWAYKLSGLNNILFNYTSTLRTRSQHVQQQLNQQQNNLIKD